MKTIISFLIVFLTLSLAKVYAQPVPNGIPAPAGFQWKIAYDEEFINESAINPNVWNATSGTILLSAQNGLSLDGTNASLVNTNDSITQRYGVWEFLAKYPHNDSGEANGYHTDLYLGNAASQFNTIYIEDDICENSIQFTGPTNCQNAINDTFDPSNPSRGKQTFRVLVPNGGSGSPSIGDAFHTWAMAWIPGSQQGQVSDYFDGIQQTNTITNLTNSSWTFGARPLMTNRSCESTSNCNPTGNNPLFVKYFRVWQLVPGTGPSPTPVPTSVPTPVIGGTYLIGN